MKFKVGDRVIVVNKLALHGQIAKITEVKKVSEEEDEEYKINIGGITNTYFGPEELEPYTKLHEALK